jgi:hypothetical protein
MAIVINGSGTVTGISVGGLPDGIVDAGTLATDSVDSAELIDGAVDNSHMAAMAASKLTGALPAISGASLTGIPSIDVDADGWARVADTVDMASAAVIDWTNSIHLGSNCTESGGRITVGTAGWYLVSFHLSNASAASRTMDMRLRKNTSLQLGNIFWQGNTEINYLGTEATVLIECAADDILDVYGSGYFAGNTTNESISWFTGVRIGA